MDNIKFISKIMAENETLSRSDHRICRILMERMSDAELNQLRCTIKLDWYLYQLIEERFENKPTETKEHNKSWQTYFNDIKERKIGNVVNARNKLQDAFKHLEWKAQRQILWMFLSESTMSDRKWALNTMSDNWSLIGDCTKAEQAEWQGCILRQWNEHHEYEAARVIVKYFPYSEVAKREDELKTILRYVTVALRLGENADYKINRELLLDTEYLYVMAKLGRSIDKETAEIILAEVILDAADRHECPILAKHELPSLMDDSKVSLAIWCLGRLGHTDLIQDFYNKNREWQKTARGPISDEEWEYLCGSIPKYFPLLKNHKKELLKKWMEEYPALRGLVKKLKLGVKDIW